MTDMVNHPPHYTEHPIFSGECIDYTKYMTFTQGNAFKYLWRMGMKDDPIIDMSKALWYIEEHYKTLPVPMELTMKLSGDLGKYGYFDDANQGLYVIGRAMLAIALRQVNTAKKILEEQRG